MITTTEYMEEATKTRSPESDIMQFVLGLTSEAGEVAGAFEKFYYQNHDSDLREKVKKEAGDVLWYLVNLLDELDLSLDEVMEANVAKLKKRYANQVFTAEASMSRVDVTNN